jgi:hypothetical protein
MAERVYRETRTVGRGNVSIQDHGMQKSELQGLLG